MIFRTVAQARASLSASGVIASFLVAMLAAASALAGVPNDDCSDATTIQLGETPFTTEDATSDGPGVCEPFGLDVWFKHRAKFTGQLRVSTCDDANFDTVITVYRGTACSDEDLLDNQIGCNDDGPGCADHTSELTVNVTRDQLYLIRIGGFNADSGSGILTLACGDEESATCADIIKTGAEADDRLGYAIAKGGLMDAGNTADVLIGAYRSDVAGSNAGQARAFRGPGLANLYTLNGENPGDNYGFATATCDFNNDGRVDLLIGAPLNDDAAANAGKVYAIDGFTGALMWTAVGQTAGDRFGNACGCAGDVNDDGFDDAIVGAPFHDANGTSTGRAYILDGEDGDRLRTHTGQAAGDQFGAAVSGVDDLNDDGNDDYAVGSPRHDEAGNDSGRVSIFNGDTGTPLIRLDGDDEGDRFGSAIASDRFTATFDYTFILIGSPYNDFGGSAAGRARVFFRNHDNPGEGGCDQLVCLRYTINGSEPGARLGSAVALGDLVGNSAADMVVGSPFHEGDGAAFLFDGNGASLRRRFFGEASGDRFGTAVAFADDIDNDGENDVVIGGPFNNSGGNNAGRAYAFLFGDDNKALSANAGQHLPGDPDAPTVAPSGEMDGDATLDGRVNVDDMIAVIASWGPCAIAPGAPCHADLNRDQQVNIDDLLIVLAAWH